MIDSVSERVYSMGVSKREMNESDGFEEKKKGGAKMLTEQRHQEILRLVNSHQTITSQDLVDHLDTSESTIRRDLLELEGKGLLWRIRGGAKARQAAGLNDKDSRVSARRGQNAEEKKKIAAFANQLIEPGDTVFIDGGTSTEYLVELISQKEALYVTNAIFHANILSQKGLQVCLAGGQYKAVTETVIGEEACEYLDKYNFSIGFFGTNGISAEGFTTPELSEGMLKKKAISRCQKSYVLADPSKFGLRQRIVYARADQCTVLTTASDLQAGLPEELEIIDVEKVSSENRH